MVVREVAVRDSYRTPIQIDLADAAADENRAAQNTAERRAYVTGFQAAAGHFGKHWRKEQRIGLTHERDRYRRLIPKLLLEARGGAHAREAAA